MSNEYKGELARYDATVSRQDVYWRTMFDLFVHSDRATIDVGIGALKTAILVNAGALVMLLAFVGEVWNKDGGRKIAAYILTAGHLFVIGVILGAISFAFAYLFQYLATRQYYLYFEEVYGGKSPLRLQTWTSPAALSIKVVMLFLTACSIGFFIWGCFTVIGIFNAFA